jgi:hypothetical protein
MNEIPVINGRTVQQVPEGLTNDEVATYVATVLGPYHPSARFAQGLRARLERHHARANARRLREVDLTRAEALSNGVRIVVDSTLPHVFVREELPDEALPVRPTRQHPDGPLPTYHRLHGKDVIAERP